MEMNMHPALSMQTSGGQCFKDSQVYGPYRSPWPVLPNPLEDFPKSPAPFPVSALSDLLANPPEIQTDPVVSQNGQHNRSSFLLELLTDFHSSTFSPRDLSSRNAALISQPLEGVTHFPPDRSPCLDVPSAGYLNYQEEDDHYSWSASRFQGLLDFPGGASLASSQVGTTIEAMYNEADAKEIHWRAFAEDLHPGYVESNWNESLVDLNVGNQPQKVLQSSSDAAVHQPQREQPSLPSREVSTIANPSTSAQLSSDVIVHQLPTQQQLSLSSRELVAATNPSTPAQSSKPRMRWTRELHDAFIDAVNHLGGTERAKPKAILDHMNVEGVHIQHVKSHLQKYRSARVKPELLDGNSQERTTAPERASSVDLRTNAAITEALRVQMEVQKQLHEQLEIQRKLQLKIEQQGKYLLQMLENQNKMEQEKLKPLPNNGSSDPSNSGASGLDQLQVAAGITTLSQASRETSCGSKGKQKGSEGNGSASGDLHSVAGGSSPPTKRSKLDDAFH